MQGTRLPKIRFFNYFDFNRKRETLILKEKKSVFPLNALRLMRVNIKLQFYTVSHAS